MGLLYKVFQGVAYDSMEIARDYGKKHEIKNKNYNKLKPTYYDDDNSIKDFISEYKSKYYE